MRDAVRGLMEPPERLTIARTDSMVIITTVDGRTTRLAPDGSRITDQSTGIVARSRWDSGRLVTEVSGVPLGKVFTTYEVSPGTAQLVVTLRIDAGRSAQRIMRFVYDAG